MTKTNRNEVREMMKRDDLEAFKSFIENDREQLTVDTSFAGTWLHFAAENGNVRFVEFLLDQGMDPNFLGNSDSLPIECAVRGGAKEVVDRLLIYGAAFNLHSLLGNPFLEAISQNDVEMVQFLLSRGFDPNIELVRDDGSRRNAMSYALDQGAMEIIEVLMGVGCAQPLAKSSELEARLVRHVECHFGSSQRLELKSQRKEDNKMMIQLVRPSTEHLFATLFSIGLSTCDLQPPEGAIGFENIELLWHLPPDWPDLIIEADNPESLWPAQIMLRIANYVVDGNWLGPIPTVAFSEPPSPFCEFTKMSALLLVPGKISQLSLSEDKFVDFYTIHPVYASELQFAKENGVEALLERLQEYGVTALLAPNRQNTCV